MADLKWKEAIEKVLNEEKKQLHYTEIAELIAERGYRKALGATPQDTVSAQMTTDINTKKEKSIFAKTAKGYYILRKYLNQSVDSETDESEPEIVNDKIVTKDSHKIVNAFGIYWNRNLVHWKSQPDLLGIQQIGATEVNFKDQIGIYLLHDSRETVYVGQAIEQPLGKSTIQNLGDILEAILIESIEPRQNRKQGNSFVGLEYLQMEAPEIKKKLKQQLIQELTDKL